MSRKIVFFLFLLLTALALTSCDVTCDPGSLVQPDLISPDWREVMDGSAAVLEWSYPDTCEPEEFEIILSKDRDYAVIEHTELVPGDSTTWTAPTLDIAEEYWWRVRAKVGSTYGSYSGERRSFFTLPYCTSGDLYRPNPVSPEYGGIFTRGYDSLEWEWPISACIPESYRVELSTESDFSDTSLNGGTGSPGTRWGPGSPLDPATQYFWRITPFADGTWGPTSIAYSFFTDPICSGASLVAPNAVTPLNGDTLATANPDFEWTYPHTGCSPEGTHFQIATTPDFSAIYIDADNPNHASRSMFFGVPLNDCSTYYWRVAMVSEGVYGPYSFPQAFSVDLTDSCTCDPASVPIPSLVWPGPYEIVPDLLPRLQWATSEPCLPEGYGIDLNRFHDFSGPDLGGGAIHPTISWSPASPLEPATQYWWKVFSGVGTDFSDPSGQRSFFTGPECTSLTEVVAPVRLAPADGSIVNTLTPALKYTPGSPGCIPDGYLLELHELADFSDPNLLTEYSLPATTVFTDPLTDCQEYHWSVTAIQDGGYGPESDHGSFFVDVDGTCSSPGVPGEAKSNFFCRASTWEISDALWTVENGHRVLAIARNPQTTYVLLNVLDQNTMEPFTHEIHCWAYLGNIVPGGPETPQDVEYDFGDLPVVNPPDPPEEEPDTAPICQSNLGAEECKKAGGSYELVAATTKQYECVCP